MSHGEYSFPRAFIQGEQDSWYLSPAGECFNLVQGSGECGEVIYEEVLSKAFDLASSTLFKDLCILTRKGVVLVAAERTKVVLQEISGLRIVLEAEEGDTVKEGDVIAYTLTSKGETRIHRSMASGIILYIGCPPGSQPEKCIVVVADEGSIRKRELCRG